MPTPDPSWPPQAVAAFVQRAELIDVGYLATYALVAVGFVAALLLAGVLIVTGLRR